MTNLIAHFKQKRWASIFVIYIRYLIGAAFVISSIPKVLGERFMTSNCEDAPINSFPHLFETLYRSGLYWEFLGWGQIIAALLLMIQILTTLGAVTFFPIMINIFVISISYELGIGLPIITGLMLTTNIFLLMWDYNKLHVLLKPDRNKDLIIANHYSEFYNNIFWVYLGLIIFVTTVIYVLIYGRNPTTWVFICLTEGLVGLIYMIRKYKKRGIPQT